MLYTVEYSRKAAQQLRKLPRDIQKRLKPHIEALSQNPRPRGVKKLRGFKNFYRIRVSDYRVIYKIEDKRLVVIIMEVAYRRDAYRR